MESGVANGTSLKSKGVKFLRIIFLIAFIAGSGFTYFRYYYVFGSGIKTGTLNYVVHKGYLFKTYEGEMIMSGITSGKTGIRSNEFVFSIHNEQLAEELMRMGGKVVELRYKEYLAPLPWRGNSKFVVDSILVVYTVPHQENAQFPLE